MARHLWWPLLIAAACASAPVSAYVPGGEGLGRSARLAYRDVLRHKREGDIHAALDILDGLCADHPLRLGFHLLRLRLARESRGIEYAVSLYETPPHGVGKERAGILATLAGLDEDDLSGRQGVLDFAAQREPGEAFWRLGVAEVGLASHDLVIARARREHELGMVQDSAESFQEAQRVLERARQNAETALQYDPEFAEAHLLLGYIATRMADMLADDLEKRDAWRNTAGVHYEESLVLDPGSVPGYLNLAENHLYFDRYTEAAQALLAAAELAPSEPRIWNNLGVTYYATGLLDQAVQAYRRALEVAPDDARARTALADCLRRLDRMKDAVRELEEARVHAEGDRELLAEIAFKLATIHEHEARYRKAVQEYRRHADLGGKDAAKAESRIRRIFESAYEK